MPKRRNEQEICSRSEPFAWRGEYDASNNLIYEGWAAPGSTEGAAVWLMCKYTYDASNNLTKTEWAYDSNNNIADFTNIWTTPSGRTYV